MLLLTLFYLAKILAVTTNIIILAAGAGSRMHSALPKVLQPLAGKPLLGHILSTVHTHLQNSAVHLITGHASDQVKAYCQTQPSHSAIQYHSQTEQLGTGHAVIQALPALDDTGISIILYGDVPLISASTLRALLDKVSDSSMALLTQVLDNPFGYGRIVRENDHIVAIVEEKDANDAQRQINETNTGIMAIKNSHLHTLLPQINNQNQQGEYYLTDLIDLAHQKNIRIKGLSVENPSEVQGVNDKAQLANLERDFQHQKAQQLLQQGTTLADPARFDLRGDIKVGSDVFIDINCLIQGTVTLGNHVSIGPNCIIGEAGQSVTIGDHVEIKANSIIEAGTIDNHCVIGPFARIRPDTHLKENAKIGNFVEIKKSIVGAGSKVNHLSYIGDAHIGEKANIGAGTITCNYDGVNKHQTQIGDEAFIGSNTSLVAPVTIGNKSTVAAGSTITKNSQDEQLAIARGKQRNIDNWQRPEKK